VSTEKAFGQRLPCDICIPPTKNIWPRPPLSSSSLAPSPSVAWAQCVMPPSIGMGAWLVQTPVLGLNDAVCLPIQAYAGTPVNPPNIQNRPDKPSP